MSGSSPQQPRKPLDRSTARNCALINQLATPGLGSLMARRFVAGTGQILLALGGFGMMITWFVLLAVQTYHQITNDLPPRPVGWLGGAGALVFAASWLWSLFTSLSILREARANEPQSRPDLPG